VLSKGETPTGLYLAQNYTSYMLYCAPQQFFFFWKAQIRFNKFVVGERNGQETRHSVNTL